MNRKLNAVVRLAPGAHRSPKEGLCVMEAVAFVAGELHSDTPACASKVASAFLRRWNDDLDDEGRQRLMRFVVNPDGTPGPLVGSSGTPEVELRRSWMAMDWLVRVQTPAWLDLAKLTELAAKLRALPELRDEAALMAAQPIIDEAKRSADAAWAAAWDAAWDAARDAARAAARAAAWDAAGAAARDAAGAAAWAAAWDAARGAARDAAWAAAWDAARAAAWDAAWGAARDAAWAALKPTIRSLQESALKLLERMLSEGSRR